MYDSSTSGGGRGGGSEPDAGTGPGTVDAPGRIVSLAPSATATLSALGADERIVGVTTHCDLDRPTVGGWLTPDYDRLADLDPDLVCTCDDLQASIRDDLRERGHDVHHVAPSTLPEVLASFEALGAAVGRADAAADLVAAFDEHLDGVGSAGVAGVAGTEDDCDGRPVVYCEEWGDPPMAAGNWVPDLVAAAGGRYPLVETGERSREVSREAVAAVDPDHVILHHCGADDGTDPRVLDRRGWDLDAAVHVVDDSLLNQPSPRLLDGAETLAALFSD